MSEPVDEAETVLVRGRELPRVRFGYERDVADSPCVGCGRYYFDYHAPGCDWEQCPACGGQLVTCGCAG